MLNYKEKNNTVNKPKQASYLKIQQNRG